MAKSPKRDPVKPSPAVEPSSGEERQPYSPHLWMRNRYLSARKKNIVYGQGRFWRYQTGVYTEIPLLQVRKEIADLGSSDSNQWFQVTSTSVGSVAELVRDHCMVRDERFDSNPDILVFNDCVLDLNTFETLPHSAKYFATSNLPFNYDPDAKCEAWSKWGERIDPDLLSYLEEFGGLCLTTDQRYEKSVWLVGKPNSGKGTFIQALCVSLGVKRWTTISSADIGNRFGLVNLAGKTLAFASESPPIKTANCIDIVNRIISGEPIRVEQKGQPGYDLTPRCKILCAMNVKPAVHNPDSGLFRRTDIVPMPPLDVAINPAIKEQIVSNGQAMVNVFLAGLRRLRERGHFDVPRSVQIASAEFRAENDHVALFLEDQYTLDPDGREQTGSVYTLYQQWCKDNGFRNVLNSKELIPELGRLGIVYKRSNGSWYEGLKR